MLVSALGIYIHAIFLTISLGFPWIILSLLFKWWRTKDEDYYLATRTLTGVLGLNFALGAITGTLVEFGLVQAWPGTIFVIATFAFLPLTLELVAFVGEVVLLILFIVTMRRVKVPISIGIMTLYLIMAAFSGIVITTVNSWLNVPWGTQALASALYPFLPSYGPMAVNPGAIITLKAALVRALLTNSPPSMLIQDPKVAQTIGLTLLDPSIAFQSPYALVSMLHNVNAGIIIGICFGLAGYAYRFLRTGEKKCLKIMRAILPALLILMVLQPIVLGDSMGKMVAAYQPTKFALMEGVNNTRNDPLIGFLGYGDPQHPVIGFDSFRKECQTLNGRTLGDLMNNSTGNPESSLSLRQLCASDIAKAQADITIVNAAFLTKIAAGIVALVLLIALATQLFNLGLFSRIGDKVLSRVGLRRSIALLSFLVLASSATAASLGWFVREVGRKPWTVYGLLYPEELMTPVPVNPVVLALFVLVFVSMAIIGLYGMYIVATKTPRFVELLKKGAGVEE